MKLIPILASVALLLAGLLPSCSILEASAQGDTPAALVRTSRATYEILAPSLRGYIESDPELSDAARNFLLFILEDWDKTLERMEAELENPAPPEIPPPIAPPMPAPGESTPET